MTILVQQLRAEIEQLKAENAELRRDAQRYQWLRDAKNTEGPSMVAVYGSGELDNAIDQAMSEDQT